MPGFRYKNFRIDQSGIHIYSGPNGATVIPFSEVKMVSITRRSLVKNSIPTLLMSLPFLIVPFLLNVSLFEEGGLQILDNMMRGRGGAFILGMSLLSIAFGGWVVSQVFLQRLVLSIQVNDGSEFRLKLGRKKMIASIIREIAKKIGADKFKVEESVLMELDLI